MESFYELYSLQNQEKAGPARRPEFIQAQVGPMGPRGSPGPPGNPVSTQLVKFNYNNDLILKLYLKSVFLSDTQSN